MLRSFSFKVRKQRACVTISGSGCTEHRHKSHRHKSHCHKSHRHKSHCHKSHRHKSHRYKWQGLKRRKVYQID